ncbi:MAG: 16S rRNA (guanine(527)-N(7))-methyltransferase RsmG [Opitutae bacterium]|nr:16S rRNA (guanine(527)-N(7))-methyltransferase RsmG [Opitutae bacterium]MCD8298595.1 16S rRNA (guanine(527)-N(7))-methyltransferase RsmG [Opitutae bacterium]
METDAFSRLKNAFAGDGISDAAWEKIGAMAALHREWNAKINLVSRKDIDNLELHHYAPCLAVVRFLRLMAGARVADVGTGGGFPGLLLAVVFPQARFTLIDSIAKKIGVVDDIAKKLGLKNVETCVVRAENFSKKFDFVTGRAVSNLPQFFGFVRKLLAPGMKNSLANGIIYWKGGEIATETDALGCEPDKIYDLREMLGDDYFAEKYILHFRCGDVFRARRPGFARR